VLIIQIFHCNEVIKVLSMGELSRSRRWNRYRDRSQNFEWGHIMKANLSWSWIWVKFCLLIANLFLFLFFVLKVRL